MKDASHHPKKLQKKILREIRKDSNHINGKSKEGVVAMTADFQDYNMRKQPRAI